MSKEKRQDLEYCACGCTLKKDNQTGLCITCFNEQEEKRGSS